MSFLRSIFRRSQRDQQLEEEIQSHLQMARDRMDPAKATTKRGTLSGANSATFWW
jgi:hypothetical protein